MLAFWSNKDFADRPFNVLLLDQAIKQYPKFSGPLSFQPLGPGKHSLLLLLLVSRVTLLRSLISYATIFYFIRGSVTHLAVLLLFSLSVMSNYLQPHGLLPARLLCPKDSPDKKTGVGCHFLLQEIFPTQGSNPGLLHCGRTLYCLSHQAISPYMQTTSCKMPDQMNHKLESRLPG